MKNINIEKKRRAGSIISIILIKKCPIFYTIRLVQGLPQAF